MDTSSFYSIIHNITAKYCSVTVKLGFGEGKVSEEYRRKYSFVRLSVHSFVESFRMFTLQNFFHRHYTQHNGIVLLNRM